MQPHQFQLFKQTFAEFLSLPAWKWSWVVHQTFDDCKVRPSPSAIPWSWSHFQRTIARDAMMNYGFYFAERGKVSGRIHWHALVHVKENLLGQPRRRVVWKEMFDTFGRCSVHPYLGPYQGASALTIKRLSTGIATYLTKYVAKDSYSDDATWDFTGFMGGSTADCGRIGRLIGIDTSDWPEIL